MLFLVSLMDFGNEHIDETAHLCSYQGVSLGSLLSAVSISSFSAK